MIRVDRRIVIARPVLSLASAARAGGGVSPDPDPRSPRLTPRRSSATGRPTATRRPAGSCCISRANPTSEAISMAVCSLPRSAIISKLVASKRSRRAAPGDSWRELRTLVNALFLRRYDPEYLEEMKGIADGAAAGGAKFDGRSLDLIDVVAINSEIEVEFLDAALHATATGLEGERLRRTRGSPSPPRRPPSTVAPSRRPGPRRPTARSCSATSPCSASRSCATSTSGSTSSRAPVTAS